MISFLKKMLEESNAPKGELIPALIKNLGGYYPERSHKTVHASDITKSDWCPRQYALMDIEGLQVKDRYLGAGLKATFDIGEATSDMVRENWMGKKSVGHWRCTGCNTVSYFTTKPEEPCGHCKAPNWKYMELKFFDPGIQVSGSIDMLADLGGLYLPVELKIMRVDEFESLVAPLAEHRIRTSLYLRLIDNSTSIYKGKINTQRAKVLYVSRGFGKKSGEHGQIVPFKEFDVERNDDSVEPYLKKPRQLKIFREDGGPLPDRVCSDPAKPQAKKCQVCAQCFKETAS